MDRFNNDEKLKSTKEEEKDTFKEEQEENLTDQPYEIPQSQSEGSQTLELESDGEEIKGDPSPYSRENPKKERERKRRPSWLIPILLGVIIGILLTTVALPVLVDSGFIKSIEGGDKDNKQGNEVSDPVNSTADKHVSVDVSSQVTEIVDEVLPAVVGVTNIQHRADFWRQQTENEAGTGSGVIYKKDDDYAYIVTNHHVIERADLIEVVLADETTVEANLLGSDLFSDLAVLRIDSSKVDKVIELGSSDMIKVGEPAIAIGNPLGHMFSGTVTQGVISGTKRTIPLDFNNDGRADWQAEVIQTDAAINPGNSGGALINIEGQLIGINSMKINQASVEGIGFAIPIDSAWPIIEELEKTGEVTRPFLGVEIYSLDDVPKSEWSRTLKLPEEIQGGVYVWSVEPFSPADRAGLTRLDVITELDGKKIMSSLDLRKVLYQDKKIGESMDIVFYRDGERREVTIELGSQ